MRKILSLFFTGVYIGLTLGTPALLLSGCEGSAQTRAARDQALIDARATDKAKDAQVKKTVAQATSNLDAVAGALQTTGRVPEGQAVELQASAIDDALGISEAEKPMARVSQAEWEFIKGDLSKAKPALSDLKTVAAEQKAELDRTKLVADEADRKAAVWEQRYAEEVAAARKAKIWGAVGGVAAVGLWVARVMNVPGINLLSDPLLKLIGRPLLQPLEAKVEAVQQTASTAATVVMSSDIGRAALGRLDQFIRRSDDPNAQSAVRFLEAAIGRATGGKADNIEGLFKEVARGVAVDQERSAEAAAYLTNLRSKEIDTDLGQPTAVAKLFV